MVTFNCEVCNETVPKKNTEKHYYRCSDAYYTCIDCNKTFDDGISYKKHTQCITEDEKYQKALYKGKKKNGKNCEIKKINIHDIKVNQNNKPHDEFKKTKKCNKTILKTGESLYKIMKSIKSKDEKKSLLKKLVVLEEGKLVLKE